MPNRKAHDSMQLISLRPEPAAKREIRFTRSPPSVDVLHVRLGHPIGIRHRIMLDRVRPSSGLYSRPGLTTARTVCNLSLVDSYYAPLDESYEGVLCPNCFWPNEIEAANELARIEEQRLHEEAERWERERTEDMERALSESRERVRQHRAPSKPSEPDDE